MTELDIARHDPLLDPHLHVWGWEIPLYLFLGGLAAGLMILTSALILTRNTRSASARWLAFAAPALVSLGMGALFLDLASRTHAWRFYVAFRWTSPMSWGAWILILVYPASLLLALAGLGEVEARQAEDFLRRLRLDGLARAARRLGPRRLRALCWAHLLVGVGLGAYTGILLSTLGARALWSSALLGPLFLVSGLSAGAAFLALFRVSAEERALLVRWDRLAMAFELVLLALFLVGLSTSGQAGKEAARLLLGGPFTAPFWSLVVICGLAMPLLLEALGSRLRLRFTAIAPALVLAGGLALRWILVAAGQA